MAKFEKSLSGNFDEFTNYMHEAITRGSVSATFEDGSDFNAGTTRIAVRVYERYSMIGGNRVSMNITMIGDGGRLFITAITSGGSQAVFFKINTLGEGSFLDQCIGAVERYASGDHRK